MCEADKSIIDTTLFLDAKQLIEMVEKKRYTICGYLPVTTMMVATKKLGAKKAELPKYATSHDTSGTTDLLVGYGFIVLNK
jgi:AmmeMemoRadiSam system protein B